MSEIELAERFDLMNKVVAEMLKGSNATQISKDLSIKRGEVLQLIDELIHFLPNLMRLKQLLSFFFSIKLVEKVILQQKIILFLNHY
jgi:hypothetical protein